MGNIANTPEPEELSKFKSATIPGMQADQLTERARLQLQPTGWRRLIGFAGVPLILVLLLAGVVLSLWLLRSGSEVTSNRSASAGKSLVVTNPGFEEGLHGWVDGYARWEEKPNSNYEVVIDKTVAHQGRSSASIMPIIAEINRMNSNANYGAITYKMAAEELRGKRVRYSAYVKAEDINSAGLLMEVHGNMEVPGIVGRVRTSSHFQLRRDDMNSRPIQGTVDWGRYEVVIDVPEEAEFILFGLDMWSEQGRMWLDDSQLDIVGDDVALTCRGNAKMTGNSDFEQQPAQDGYMPWKEHMGPKFYTYHAGTSRQAAYEGELGAYLKIDEPATNPDYYALIEDAIDVSCLEGRKVTLSVYTNTDAVNGRAVLWARVEYALENGDEAEREGRSYLNGDHLYEEITITPSADTKGDGKIGWQRQELTLDIPYTSSTFLIGVRLYGEGEIWIDNVRVDAEGY